MDEVPIPLLRNRVDQEITGAVAILQMLYACRGNLALAAKELQAAGGASEHDLDELLTFTKETSDWPRVRDLEKVRARLGVVSRDPTAETKLATELVAPQHT